MLYNFELKDVKASNLKFFKKYSLKFLFFKTTTWSCGFSTLLLLLMQTYEQHDIKTNEHPNKKLEI